MKAKQVAARRTLHYFWHELRNHKFMIGALLVLTVAAIVTTNYIWPLFMSEMINRLSENSATTFMELLPLALGAIGFSMLGNIILWRLVLVVHWKLDLKVWRILSEKVFTSLAQQSMHFHNDKFSGSLVSQTNKFVGAFDRLMDTWTWNLFPMIIAIFAVCGILAFVGLGWLAFGLFVMSALFIVYTILGFKKIGILSEKFASAENKLSGQLADSISNIFAVKSFAREKYETARYKTRNQRVIKASTDMLWGVVRLQIVFSIIVSIMIAAAILLLAGGGEWFGIQVGTLVLAVTYTINLVNNIWQFNNVMHQIQRSFGDAHEMTKILDEPILVKDLPNAKNMNVSRSDVEFRAISFHHADTKDDEIFRDFNLKIPAGQRVGLVGHSGSGKTTLTKLLLRFADVQNGEILIDGQNIAAVSQKSLRENIAYVPQEPLLFHRSIRENIAYGRPSATETEIRAAAARANALEFIDKLPNGLDTLTGERGVKLSGGQRQRIVIARAILKDAPILILDEATSALDTENEKLIQQALMRLMQGRTSIVIAHRLSTVAELDRIILLDNGRIIEDDTHANLIKRGGKYAKLWNQQTGLSSEDSE